MVVVGAGRHPKFVRFTDSERCAHFLGVLSLAAQAPIRGYLLVAEGVPAEADHIANEASVHLRVARSYMRKAVEAGVLKFDERWQAWRGVDWRRQHSLLVHRTTLSPARRAAVITRDGGVCGLCGSDVAEGDIEIDHVLPVAHGGTDDIANLQVSHRACNRRKGARR